MPLPTPIIVTYTELNDYDCYHYNIDDCRDLIIQ